MSVRFTWNRSGQAAVRARIDEIVQNGAQEMAEDAQEYAPVDTGFLQDNVEAIKLDEMKARVQANANYAVFVELGTIQHQAQPFMRPAAYKKRSV